MGGFGWEPVGPCLTVIDIEVSKLAIGFQKVFIVRLPQCTNTTHNFASRIAHLLAASNYKSLTKQICENTCDLCIFTKKTCENTALFKLYFHKSCKTYQLNNQTTCLLKPTKFLIWLVYTQPSFQSDLGLGLQQRIIILHIGRDTQLPVQKSQCLCLHLMCRFMCMDLSHPGHKAANSLGVFSLLCNYCAIDFLNQLNNGGCNNL